MSFVKYEENRENISSGITTLKPLSLKQPDVALENSHVEENKCEPPQVASDKETIQVSYQKAKEQLAEGIATKLITTFIEDAVDVVCRIASHQHRQTETKSQNGVEAHRQVGAEDTIHEMKPKKEQGITGEVLKRISHMLSNVLLEDALHTVIQIYRRPIVMVRCSRPREEIQAVSDQNVVSKKVSSILASLDCPKSPKERYRPQDLMVLSVVPDDVEEVTDHSSTALEDIQLGPVLNTFHDQQTELFDDQEWFEDDLGLSSKGRQDDQLLLQQQLLLEQYQQYFYRQIPNKPPPPYTPPQSTTPRSKVDLQKAAQPKAFSFVPQSYEELKEITDKTAVDVFDKLVLGHNLWDIHCNDQFFQEESNNREVTILSQQSFRTFIFNLIKEITADLYHIGCQEVLPLWVRRQQLTPKPPLPSCASQFTTTVENCVAQKLGFKPCNKSNISSRCGFKKLVRKKRDFVDTILIQELKEEEQEWVCYDEDEVTVKIQISSAIFNFLLDDAIHLAKRLFERTTHLLEK
ncbi:centrosome-associated protein 350-like [Limulus polyphemus]|uniref:Centrosome-associated protein 350-like n=1 Tax=Limulus polyphemus TaxID=6850 RepID=A0ABM1T2C9_LIMPO|nr:centrosome-associated protein 350-like [Limulus polyphemus]